jgi:CheY-like chemotaxis protein
MRILIVANYDRSGFALAALLKQQGYQVKTAGGVNDAVKLCDQEQFDLFVSDGLQFKDGNGLELMRRFAERGRIRGLALAGDPTDESPEIAKAAGFHEYLLKPTNFPSIEAAIERASH